MPKQPTTTTSALPAQCHLISDKPSASAASGATVECHLLSDKLAGASGKECHLIGDKPPGTAGIELRVRNHPGAMSHITGLFARRAFNLEAIVCAPREDDAGATSRMLLLVADGPQLPQVERQLLKLHDVLEVRHRGDLDRAFFARVVNVVPAREAIDVPV